MEIIDSGLFDIDLFIAPKDIVNVIQDHPVEVQPNGLDGYCHNRSNILPFISGISDNQIKYTDT